MKLKDLLNNKNNFQEISTNKSLTGKEALLLLRLYSQLEPELIRYGEIEKEVFKKYCNKDDKGNPVEDEKGLATIDKTKTKNFIEEMNEVREVELPVFNPITIKLTDNITGISTSMIQSLKGFINFE